MKHKEPRSLQDILTNETGSLFTRLARQQSNNDTLLDRIRALLPEKIAQHLVAVTYREQVLVMVADSPAWANRIRFENEQIKVKLINSNIFKRNDNVSGSVIQKIVVRTAASKIG